MTSESTLPSPKKRRTVPLMLVVLVAVLIVVIGFTHIVHGGGVRIAVCAKDGWALEDTFVNLDDYIGKPLIATIDKAKVVRAMFACGTLQRPDWLDSEKRPSRGMEMFRESTVDKTKLKLKRYAYEAYPSWSTAHPDKDCPEKLADLNEYMDGGDSNDSWGRPLKMLCGSNLPAGAKGIAVISAGEDGKEGTADDLKSWE